MARSPTHPGSIACLLLLVAAKAIAADRIVGTTAEFAAALSAAMPGDQILLRPGIYGGGHFRANLRQVTIRSLNPQDQAIIDGGSSGIQLSDAREVTIADLTFRNQTDNGLNIDDGGTFNTPTTGITLRNLTVRDIVTAGNHDGIKLSGVTGFVVDGVQVRNWGTGGSAVDMVGCHHGLIQNSQFVHTNASYAGTTLQPKGGSKEIVFRANRIDLPRGAGRAVQAGGSTGTPFFRFIDGDSNYEADQITAEGNVIVGGMSAFSWVNIDGGVFHHNFVHRPGNWVARILNENPGHAIIDTQNGRLHDNRIVYNDVANEFSTAVNVGSETLPASFQFARNRWLNLANPTSAGSTPSLPTAETGGIYGDTTLGNELDSAIVWDFPWGKWVVNANPVPKSVQIASSAAFRRAVPGVSAEFHPLSDDPLAGDWSAVAIPAAPIELPAYSQAILIDVKACPGCLSSIGDFNADGLVNLADYETWQAAYGSASAAADGNGDGVVDSADYVVWRHATTTIAPQIGSPPTGFLPVPEPRTFWLAVSSTLLACRPRSGGDFIGARSSAR